MLVCLFTFFPLLFKHCTAASQTFSKTTGGKQGNMYDQFYVDAIYLRLFHIIIRGREEGRKMRGGGIFRLFIKSLRGIWQKKINFNWKETTIGIFTKQIE